MEDLRLCTLAHARSGHYAAGGRVATPLQCEHRPRQAQPVSPSWKTPEALPAPLHVTSKLPDWQSFCKICQKNAHLLIQTFSSLLCVLLQHCALDLTPSKARMLQQKVVMKMGLLARPSANECGLNKCICYRWAGAVMVAAALVQLRA